MHVCIPSKGRPTTSTYKLLSAANIEFTHFVEPQDKSSYNSQNVPNVHILPESNQGIAYVRNYMLDWAQKNKHEWTWMIDDDVNGFGVAVQGKAITQNANVLIEFYEHVASYRFPVNGMNYRQYAWTYSTKPKRFTINNKTAEVCTLLYIPKITWQYRARLNMKEDRDFCMQAIQHSDGIIIDLWSWFNCPGVGSNTGGLQGLYQQQRDHEASLRLADEWAPWAKLVKKTNRVDCKLDLAGFAKSLGRTVK